MINLRYHIVSITAVFLALGIGLTLGSSFLDRVTVDTLENQLETVQARVEETEAENGMLRERVAALESRDEELARDMAERLVAGHLEGVPVLVVATEGTDEALVESVVQTVGGAGGQPLGTWWLTSRWTLDDEEEVRDLAEVLELESDDVDRLQRNGAIRLADVLLPAMGPNEDPIEEAPAEGEGEGVATPAEPAAPAEPEDAASLEAAGFLDYTLPAGVDGDRVVLPSSGVRVVVVSGALPGTGPHLVALSLLDEVSGEGPVPVVAAQGDIALEGEDGSPRPESERRTLFVGAVREGELTSERISTVDDLDAAAGLAALVLALEDAADLRVGHYGVGPGAAGLLPGTDPGS